MDEPPLHVLERIDGICDDFENALDSAAGARIESFSDRMPAPYSKHLLLHLMEIDLAYHWSKYSHGSSCDHSLQCLKECATVEAYARRFPELLQLANRDTLRSVLCLEFQIRQQKGDRPTIDERLASFPVEIADIRGDFHRMLHEYYPLLVKLYEFQQLQCTVPLRRRLEFGRQRQGEPRAGNIYTLEDFDRFVIANLDERTVGRKHADCEQVACDRVRICNYNRKSSVSVNGTNRVPAEGIWTGMPPVIVYIGSRILRIEAACERG